MSSRIESLLQAVYADPTRDAPRDVLADALLEAGDPRGEFLALQLAEARGRALSRDEKRREKQLLAAHAEDWLGPLSGWTPKGERVFLRGFLAACRVEQRSRRAGPFPETAAWATVERLLVHGTSLDRLRWFRGVRAVDRLDFDALVPGADRWDHLVELHARGDFAPGLFDRLGRLDAFPALARLRFQYGRPRADAEWRPRAREIVDFFARLDRLASFETALGLERREHVDHLFQGPDIVLRRDAAGASLAVDLYWSNDYDDGALEDELFTLRALAEATSFVTRTTLAVRGHVGARFPGVADLQRTLPEERFAALGFRGLELGYTLKEI